MVSMSLFLKTGPCFILSSKGPLSGIFSWLFLLLLLTMPCQVNMKILHINHRDYATSFFACISGLSLLLALFSLHQALGSWRILVKVVSSYPALLLLPVFTFLHLWPSQGGWRRPGHVLEVDSSQYACLLLWGHSENDLPPAQL